MAVLAGQSDRSITGANAVAVPNYGLPCATTPGAHKDHLPRPGMVDIQRSLTRQLWSLVLDPSIVGNAPGPASWLPSSARILSDSWREISDHLARVLVALQLETHAPHQW
jgi:hypothetical protein